MYFTCFLFTFLSLKKNQIKSLLYIRLDPMQVSFCVDAIFSESFICWKRVGERGV